MAFWVAGGDTRTHHLQHLHGLPYIAGGKRRVSQSDGSDFALAELDDPRPVLKRMRRSHVDLSDLQREQPSPPGQLHALQQPFALLQQTPQRHGYGHGHGAGQGNGMAHHLQPLVDPIQAENRSFLIISERSASPDPNPEPLTACCMERTASGLSISSDTTHHQHAAVLAAEGAAPDDQQLLSDATAAWLVSQHMTSYRRRFPDSQHERILKSLIQPRAREADFSIDDDALESIFSAANALFFHNRLSRRVTWDWSHSSSPQYQSQIIGTTALRPSKQLGGFETLIVLSQPILRDRKYNRRLLISTFLHELIHSYLFICCGFSARACGGHTNGFQQIAAMIDGWAGSDALHLKEMEADLERFREEEEDEAEIDADVALPSIEDDEDFEDDWSEPDELRRPAYPPVLAGGWVRATTSSNHDYLMAGLPAVFPPRREHDRHPHHAQHYPQHISASHQSPHHHLLQLPAPRLQQQYQHHHHRNVVSDGRWEHAVHDRWTGEPGPLYAD